MHQIWYICMKNLNAIKNNVGQEVLKVVKVLHLSQLHTRWRNSEWYGQQVKIQISKTYTSTKLTAERSKTTETQQTYSQYIYALKGFNFKCPFRKTTIWDLLDNLKI